MRTLLRRTRTASSPRPVAVRAGGARARTADRRPPTSAPTSTPASGRQPIAFCPYPGPGDPTGGMSLLRHQWLTSASWERGGAVELAWCSPGGRVPCPPCRRCAVVAATRVSWHADGAIWRTSLFPERVVGDADHRSGTGHGRYARHGEGRPDSPRRFPAMLGADDDPTGFSPDEPTIAAAQRRVPQRGWAVRAGCWRR